MSNRLEMFSGLRLERPWEPNSGKGALVEYLDDFCLPLYDVMPEHDVLQYRQLAEEHLLSLVEEFKAKGLSSHSALHAAFRDHGDAQLIGNMLRNEMLREKKAFLGSLVQRSAAQSAFWGGSFYLCLAAMMWFCPRQTSLPALAFFLSPLSVGIAVGAIPFCRLRRPLLWAGLTALYPIILTSLILAARFDITAVVEFIPLWILELLLTAGGTWRFWRNRHQQEIYRRFIT